MYYTISKPSGLKLNVQRTDFNTTLNNFAKFDSFEKAQKWVSENNHRFLSVRTGKPCKLSIEKHK